MSKRAAIWIAVSSKRQAEDDKISLEYQEAEARKWCLENGYDVVGILMVRGHSRSDPNIVRMLKEYEDKGVTAYAELQALWDAKGFDVLVAYSSDRLGRSSTLINWVIETTYYEGMAVCLTNGGGLMPRNNFRVPTLIGAAQATMSMDSFKDKTYQAKRKLVANGLSVGRWPMSHLPVRDPITGRTVQVIVNEDNRPLYEAIATLLLEGMAWTHMGEALQRRYGYFTGADTLYHGKNVRRLILAPWVFGNNAVRHDRRSINWGVGRWIFDQDVPPPPDVEIYYDVIPPVFEGERMEQVKAELRRRFEIKGRGSAQKAHRFSRLCICDDCGHLMSVSTKIVDGVLRRNGYICGHSGLGIPIDRRCSNAGRTHTKKIQAFVDVQLERYLRLKGDALSDLQPPPISELTALTQDIDRTTRQIDRAIDLQIGEVDDPQLQARYRERVKELNRELVRLERERQRVLSQQAAQQRTLEAQMQTIEFVREIGLEGFWQLPDPVINQWLLRFFGDSRIAIRDKEVVSLKRRSTKKQG